MEAPHARPLDEQGFLEAISSGLPFDGESELELRVHAWWRGNDRFRQDASGTGYPTGEEALQNLEQIVNLTADGDETLLLFRAEALRQLGRFSEVHDTLSGVYCSDLWPAKSKQLEWASKQDRQLHKLFDSLLPQPTAESGQTSDALS